MEKTNTLSLVFEGSVFDLSIRPSTLVLAHAGVSNGNEKRMVRSGPSYTAVAPHERPCTGRSLSHAYPLECENGPKGCLGRQGPRPNAHRTHGLGRAVLYCAPPAPSNRVCSRFVLDSSACVGSFPGNPSLEILPQLCPFNVVACTHSRNSLPRVEILVIFANLRGARMRSALIHESRRARVHSRQARELASEGAGMREHAGIAISLGKLGVLPLLVAQRAPA